MKKVISLTSKSLPFFLGACIYCLAGTPANGQTTNKKTYFVAIDGNDSYQGTIDRPFKTLVTAVAAINNIKGPIDATIYIRQGDYSLSHSLMLSGNRSDSSRSIAFSGYQKEAVNIIGGIKLDNSKFVKVTDPHTLNRLPVNARGNVFVTDLNAQGVTDFGTLKNFGYGAPALPDALELFFNDQPLTIARWPNTGFLPIGRVLKRGNKKKKEASAFVYDNFNEPEKWSKSDDIWIAGIFGTGWAYDYLGVDSIDTNAKTIYLKESPSYGIYESADSSTHIISSARKARGFYFLNILEEIDAPGEWYLDRSDGRLYVWPPSSFHNASVCVSLLEQPMIIVGTMNNITFKNINFSSCRGDVMNFDNSNNVGISNCNFRDIGLKAINTNSCSNFHVANCTFYHIGAGVITLSGGDRKKLLPANNTIRNCEFYDYSRLYKCYSPAVTLNGVGASVTNCYIHDAPDQAIMFQGNNFLISYNHIADVCYEFSDMGSIYTGRDPSATGTIINNNYFDSVLNKSGSVAAVYFDDGSGGFTVSNNLFYATGSGYGAIHINGGANNKFMNNIFINCGKGFSNNPWTDRMWIDQFVSSTAPNAKKLTTDVDIRSEVYLKQYPFLDGFFDTTNIKPRENYISNTILFQTTSLGKSPSFVISNTFFANSNPGFANVSKMDFRMVSVPPEIQQWPGWTPIEFDKIGVK